MPRRAERIINRAVRLGLSSLNLSGCAIRVLPRSIGKARSVTSLRLDGNDLERLPDELNELRDLTELDLSHNRLTSVPQQLKQLPGLDVLDLSHNLLTESSDLFLDLPDLRVLKVSHNSLTELPPAVSRLSSLETLDVAANRLGQISASISALSNLSLLDLSSNNIKVVPGELSLLRRLVYLILDCNSDVMLPPSFAECAVVHLSVAGCSLGAFPLAICELRLLRTLTLSNNHLMELPPSIEQLHDLEELDLSHNKLKDVPSQIGELRKLQRLNLCANHLRRVPPSTGGLSRLAELRLADNGLDELPEALWDATALTNIDLRNNRLTTLPDGLARLRDLRRLRLNGNPLTSLPSEIGGMRSLIEPPPEIVAMGADAVVSYCVGSGTTQWHSKMVILGEPRVGKTQLLRALQGLPFERHSEWTRGIATATLTLAHPDCADTTMKLNVWDFGGQHILHATHQFFLSRRSLYVLVWDPTRQGEANRLTYWLDTITAQAPESPVLVVASHRDVIEETLQPELTKLYPQIRWNGSVSNRTRRGVDELREALTKQAAELPLMGEMWPDRWIAATTRVIEDRRVAIPAFAFRQILASEGLKHTETEYLGRYLHELGHVLFFDEPGLDETVILDPRAVTEQIGRVLFDPELARARGIASLSQLRSIWADVDRGLRDHYLELLRKFDLAYPIRDEPTAACLVVEHLPEEPPSELIRWKRAAQEDGWIERRVVYKLDRTLPPGIPTWFIAKTSRFGTEDRWRYGTLLQNVEGQGDLALVTADRSKHQVEIAVRGPFPQAFLHVLQSALEATLDKYSGLGVTRLIPCCCRGSRCPHMFNLDELLAQVGADPPVMSVECPRTHRELDVLAILFGLDSTITRRLLDTLRRSGAKRGKPLTEQEMFAAMLMVDQKMEETLDAQHRSEERLVEMHRELQLLFLTLLDSRERAVCPSVFVLRPCAGLTWKDLLLGKRLEVQLYCEAPGEWHPIPGGCRYEFNLPASWLRKMAPYIRALVATLKYVTPVVGPVLGVAAKEYEQMLKHDLKLMEELVKKLPEIEDHQVNVAGSAQDQEGALQLGPYELHSLCQLLEHVDKHGTWKQHLQRVATPGRGFLWVCAHHLEKLQPGMRFPHE